MRKTNVVGQDDVQHSRQVQRNLSVIRAVRMVFSSIYLSSFYWQSEDPCKLCDTEEPEEGLGNLDFFKSFAWKCKTITTTFIMEMPCMDRPGLDVFSYTNN